MWHCHYCSYNLSADVLQRNRLCPKCGSDLQCCKNCHHFDSARNQCQEPDSPWIRERETENNCPYFEMRAASPTRTEKPKEDHDSEVERAKAAFKALFRSA